MTKLLYVATYFPSGGFAFKGKIPYLRALMKGIIETAQMVKPGGIK